jgi:hypothetical protein
MKLKTISAFLLLLLTGCVSEFRPVLSTGDQHILFVDGSIVANTESTFQISESFALQSDTVPEASFVDRAAVHIMGSDGYKSSAAISQGKGVYQIAVGTLEKDVSYGIQIDYDGDIYQSELAKPLETPPIDSISWAQPEAAGAVTFRVSTHDNTKNARFFMWNYTENWEIRAVYPTSIFFDPGPDTLYVDFSLPYYYCWKSNDSGRFLVGSTESFAENRLVNHHLYAHEAGDDRFSMLYSVTVRQRAMSQGAYEYYQNVKKQNEEMGGLFTPQPSELTGNMVCTTDPAKRVMGYVEAVNNVRSERIFVDPTQLKRPIIYSDCDPLFKENGKLPTPENYAYYYKKGYRPAIIDMELYDLHPEAVVPTEWALGVCTDCRENGGSKEKPDFWPNSHW